MRDGGDAAVAVVGVGLIVAVAVCHPGEVAVGACVLIGGQRDAGGPGGGWDAGRGIYGGGRALDLHLGGIAPDVGGEMIALPAGRSAGDGFAADIGQAAVMVRII